MEVFINVVNTRASSPTYFVSRTDGFFAPTIFETPLCRNYSSVSASGAIKSPPGLANYRCRSRYGPKAAISKTNAAVVKKRKKINRTIGPTYTSRFQVASSSGWPSRNHERLAALRPVNISPKITTVQWFFCFRKFLKREKYIRSRGFHRSTPSNIFVRNETFGFYSLHTLNRIIYAAFDDTYHSR